MLGQICLGGEASRRMSRSRRIALLGSADISGIPNLYSLYCLKSGLQGDLF